MRNINLHFIKLNQLISLLIAVLVVISFISCESNNENKSTVKDITQSKGYELMTKKCYICHFEKPNPAKRDSMLAPPMLRVQEHYKPSFPNKEAFVEAVVKWVNNPNLDDALMPGAIRKFKVMPNLFYDEVEIRLIAETMYDYDFGSMPKHKGNKLQKVQLNNGTKWKVNEGTIQQISQTSQLLQEFEPNDISDYNQLGKDVFNHSKTIMLDESYSGELFDQLHYFFANVEENMHLLIATKSIDEAKEQCEILKIKFGKFNQYFEEK